MIPYKSKVLEHVKAIRRPGILGSWNYFWDRHCAEEIIPDYVATSLGDLQREHHISGAPSKILIRKVQFFPLDETINPQFEPFQIQLYDGITEMPVLVDPMGFYHSTKDPEPGQLLLGEVFDRMRPGTEIFNLVLKKFWEPSNLWVWSFDANLNLPSSSKSKDRVSILDYLDILGAEPSLVPIRGR